MSSRIFGILALGLALGACSSGEKPPTLLAAPSGEQTAKAEYEIGPFDRVSVQVFEVEELSGTYQVDGAGRLALPLLKPIPVADKTATELARAVEDAYRANYLVDPVVQVQVTEMNSRLVTVSGAVAAPGNFAVVGDLTLMQAIANAKGLNDTADRSNIVIVRTIEGQKMAARFDLTEIEAGRHVDPRIYPNDLVVVDTDETRQFVRDFGPAASVFVSVLRLFLD